MTDQSHSVRQALHDLRNHFNSIAMQTEVLKLYLGQGKTTDAEHIASGVIDLCREGGETLTSLSDQLNPPDGD